MHPRGQSARSEGTTRFVIISSFQYEPYRFLSNFWPAPVVLDGSCYPTVEHAYQAAKSADPAYRARVNAARSPGEAKRIGRTATLLPYWEAPFKIDVMRGLLAQKFAQAIASSQLEATGDAHLVEGNHWGDKFWGVCDGDGLNWLGRLLMEQRDQIRGRRAVGLLR